jgi:hypothetical protein
VTASISLLCALALLVLLGVSLNTPTRLKKPLLTRLRFLVIYLQKKIFTHRALFRADARCRILLLSTSGGLVAMCEDPFSTSRLVRIDALYSLAVASIMSGKWIQSGGISLDMFCSTQGTKSPQFLPTREVMTLPISRCNQKRRQSQHLTLVRSTI